MLFIVNKSLNEISDLKLSGVVRVDMNFGFPDEEFTFKIASTLSEIDETSNLPVPDFHGALFSIDIDDSELDNILSDSDQIMIKQDFDCDCFHVKRVPRYFRIKGFGNSLTNRYVIKELIKQRLNLECNHIFLEGFIKNTDCQFELMTGS